MTLSIMILQCCLVSDVINRLHSEAIFTARGLEHPYILLWLLKQPWWDMSCCKMNFDWALWSYFWFISFSYSAFHPLSSSIVSQAVSRLDDPGKKFNSLTNHEVSQLHGHYKTGNLFTWTLTDKKIPSCRTMAEIFNVIPGKTVNIFLLS